MQGVGKYLDEGKPPNPPGRQPLLELHQRLTQHWPGQWHAPSSEMRLKVQWVGEYLDEGKLPYPAGYLASWAKDTEFGRPGH